MCTLLVLFFVCIIATSIYVAWTLNTLFKTQQERINDLGQRLYDAKNQLAKKDIRLQIAMHNNCDK